MFPDFKDLIALLNKHKVKYLIVGGYAVARHAQPRATKDLDILIQPAPKNARRRLCSARGIRSTLAHARGSR
jgi:predicted nucleotidyltransferase